MEDFKAFSLKELISLRDKTRETNENMKVEIVNLEKQVQDSARENEKQEEKMMNAYQQKIELLRAQNVATAQKIHREEQFVVNTLYEKYKIVIKEKEKLQEKLQEEESQVIEKLQSELDKLKDTEIQLEIQLLQLKSNHKPIETDKVNEELEEMYQTSIKRKNDYNRELINLRQEIERLITANNILAQRISSTQLDLIVHKNRQHSHKGMEDGEFGKNIGKMRRYSDVTGGFIHKKKRRISE